MIVDGFCDVIDDHSPRDALFPQFLKRFEMPKRTLNRGDFILAVFIFFQYH